MQRFYWSIQSELMDAFERCALSGPQKHITKESDGFYNQFHSINYDITNQLNDQFPVGLLGSQRRSNPGKLLGHFRVPPGLCFKTDMEIIFHSHANETHLHKRGCAPSLILKVRVFGTRKWPIF